jgi:hypothetical protein
MSEVCAEPYAQYMSNFERTVFANGIAQFYYEIFTTLWKSEIHINLKIYADALNRRWRRFCVRRTMCHIYQGQRRQCAGTCACVYGICNMENKVEDETNLTDCNSNPT